MNTIKQTILHKKVTPFTIPIASKINAPPHHSISMPLRYMHSTLHVLKTIAIKQTTLYAKNPSALTQNTPTNCRGYASAHGGRLKIPTKTKQVTASSDSTEIINSDLERHAVGILAVCKNTNCAEGTAESNPCNISGEEHQALLSEAQNLESVGVVAELNGALTHKIPANASGMFLSNRDIKGNIEDQYIMHEPGIMPINKEIFRESTEKTAYLQETKITGYMIQNASTNSVMNINNKQPSTLLTTNNTPLDDKF